MREIRVVVMMSVPDDFSDDEAHEAIGCAVDTEFFHRNPAYLKARLIETQLLFPFKCGCVEFNVACAEHK